ncbi:MAG: ATP-binding protein [Bacillota bacterium]
MRYKDIYLNDFGIFNNSKIENLNPSFNIIGGGNRAGKTTFLKALRYIGFGIPNSNYIPPARSSYSLEATLSDNGDKYNLLINGYAKPKIDKINSKETDIKKIFGNIDQFTYNQLFTITLKELKKIPDGVNDKDKLMSILMGAGLKEYTLIPKLREDYLSKASNIGGKYGKINVGMFKSYNQAINEGLKQKNEAKLQVEEYYKSKNLLKETSDKIKQLDQEKTTLNKEKIKLDLLNSNYEKIDELKLLQNEVNSNKFDIIKDEEVKFYYDRSEDLFNKFKTINDELKKSKDEFKTVTGTSYCKDLQESVIKNENIIDKYYNQVSGINEKKKNLVEKNKNIKYKFNEIKNDVNNISSRLSSNLNLLLDVTVEIEYKNKLRQLVKDHNKISGNIKLIKEDLNKLTNKIAAKSERLFELKEKLKDKNTSKKYLIFIVLFTVLITWLTFINYRFAGLYIIDLILTFFYFNKKKIDDNKLMNYNEKKDELEELKTQVNQLEQKIKEQNEKKEKVALKLNEIRESLYLDENIDPNLLKDYYEDLISLRSRYNEYLDLKEEYNNKKQSFISELNNIYEDIEKIDNDILVRFDSENLYENIELLIQSINKIYQIKNMVKTIKSKLDSLKELRNDMLDLQGMELLDTTDKNMHEIIGEYTDLADLSKDYNDKIEKINTIKNQLTNLTEQMKTAFDIEDKLDQNDIIKTFTNFFNKFVSKEQLEENYLETKDELENINKKIEDKKRKREEIKLRMDNMASEEKIIQAEKKINNARSNMRPLAEKYAKNKMSAYILNKFWERFLKEKKDNLLNKASNIMNDITNGDYKKIEPKENLTSLDFKIYNNEGEVIDEINNLSRGTIEQLYMAIRINRIMDIKPALPVIIDDSLVNFDSKHLRNIFDIINNLKNRNQIFFLTCHPEQIDYLEEKIDDKNYYLLDKGRFNQVSKTDLITHLK